MTPSHPCYPSTPPYHSLPLHPDPPCDVIWVTAKIIIIKTIITGLNTDHPPPTHVTTTTTTTTPCVMTWKVIDTTPCRPTVSVSFFFFSFSLLLEEEWSRVEWSGVERVQGHHPPHLSQTLSHRLFLFFFFFSWFFLFFLFFPMAFIPPGQWLYRQGPSPHILSISGLM